MKKITRAEIAQNVHQTNGMGFIVRLYDDAGTLVRSVDFAVYENARRWAVNKGCEITDEIAASERARSAHPNAK